jgi:membrane associated rhomboid family serine protease
LIAINAVTYLLGMVLGDVWKLDWALLPVGVASAPWTLFTSAFLHVNLMHIGFNMYALYVLGQYLEVALGRWRFLMAYVLSAFAGSVTVVLLADPTSRAWVTYTLGASGAVFGLFGLILVVLRRLGRQAGAIVGVLVINAVIGFVVPGIAWQAHLGGFLVGLLLGLVFAYAPRRFRTSAAVASGVAIAGALVLMLIVKLISA